MDTLLTDHPELTLEALRAAPGVIIQTHEPAGLALAVQEAIRRLPSQPAAIAVFVVPFGRRFEGDRTPSALRLEAPSGGLLIDDRAHEVSLDGCAVRLTFKEFALLNFLFVHQGQVFSRAGLLAALWGEHYRGGMRTVDIHVRRLRKKLGDQVVDTVRGVGYRFGRATHARSAP